MTNQPPSINNICQLPKDLPTQEIFETIISTANIQIERIISTGQTTPPGEWYDQAQDEWVILLQGTASLGYADGREINLKAGDYLIIPAHHKHRVTHTSSEPPCIWLAIHGQLTE